MSTRCVGILLVTCTRPLARLIYHTIRVSTVPNNNSPRSAFSQCAFNVIQNPFYFCTREVWVNHSVCGIDYVLFMQPSAFNSIGNVRSTAALLNDSVVSRCMPVGFSHTMVVSRWLIDYRIAAAISSRCTARFCNDFCLRLRLLGCPNFHWLMFYPTSSRDRFGVNSRCA